MPRKKTLRAAVLDTDDHKSVGILRRIALCSSAFARSGNSESRKDLKAGLRTMITK
jgi:hypothetical protein